MMPMTPAIIRVKASVHHRIRCIRMRRRSTTIIAHHVMMLLLLLLRVALSVAQLISVRIVRRCVRVHVAGPRLAIHGVFVQEKRLIARATSVRLLIGLHWRLNGGTRLRFAALR